MCPTWRLAISAPAGAQLRFELAGTGRLDRVDFGYVYLRTAEGWLYRCAVRDGRLAAGDRLAIDEHLRTELVTSALAMAVAMQVSSPMR